MLDHIVQEVIRTTEEMKVTQSEMVIPNRPAISRGWERQGADIIKINCDAPWCANTSLGGIGVIVRDRSGSLRGGRHDKMVGGLAEEI